MRDTFAHLDPPDEAQGDDEGGGGHEHGDEAAEAEHVLAPKERVGEHQAGRYHVVDAPHDGDEQRRDNVGAREHLNSGNGAMSAMVGQLHKLDSAV